MLCLCLLEEIIGEEEFVLLSEVHRPSNLPFPHSAYERNKSKNATVKETRRVCRRLLHSLFAVVARDLLASLARRCFHFIPEPRTPEKKFKQIKILASLRSKMSPEITSNDPRLLVFQI